MLRMLASDPNQRLPSARAFYDALSTLTDQVDQSVGSKDIALVVGLHLAQRRRNEAPPSMAPVGLAGMLEHELDEFVKIVGGAAGDQPLDPSDFARGVSSGVRRNPAIDD